MGGYLPITAQNIALHELIGLKAKVVSSISEPFCGLEGLVVDETKNMLVLKSKEGKEKMVPKKGCKFMFSLPDGGSAILEGERIAFRPYDRPKKAR
ncbi:MAG: ribonuclease P protein subunit [Candidatus Anstonellaceae archaeon]